MTERETIARAAASLDDPDAVMPDRHNHAPDRIWLRYDGTVATDDPRPWETNPYTRSGLIPAMLQEARNEAFREAARAAGAVAAPVTGTPYSVGGRLFSQAILALIDTSAPPPAEPAGDALREATKAMVDAAFKALPADTDGTIGTGEMYRVLDAALAAAPLPSTTGERLIRAAEEATAIARGEAEPASVYRAPQPVCEHRWMIWPETDGYEQKCSKCGSYRRTLDADREAALAAAPQPAPVDREALVGVIQLARQKWADDYLSSNQDLAIADALLARGLRLSSQPETMAWAVVWEDDLIHPSLIFRDKDHVRLTPNERLVRVAIRVVEDEA